jgi:hypothetical protein
MGAFPSIFAFSFALIMAFSIMLDDSLSIVLAIFSKSCSVLPCSQLSKIVVGAANYIMNCICNKIISFSTYNTKRITHLKQIWTYTCRSNFFRLYEMSLCTGHTFIEISYQKVTHLRSNSHAANKRRHLLVWSLIPHP